MNSYCRLVPRLNGAEIEERFDYYLGLVKKGVAGFIVFGGELERVRAGLKRLQSEAVQPLMIASDLEQGLGQQLDGGTLFPPAMAIASAVKAGDEQSKVLLKDLYAAVSDEARYAGINTIFAPVLDINTNPENPIIATRAFGEDSETVSFFGCEMVKALLQGGIIACGKHFPGHGDTWADSHISLPVVNKDMASLKARELVPFERAIREGLGMIMMGHLSVPSLDPSGIPVSLSEKTVSYIRRAMGFKGILITDAMNMGGLGSYPEEEAALMSLTAGVDLILHPTDPDKVAAFLSGRNYQTGPLSIGITRREDDIMPDFSRHRSLSAEFARMAVRVEGEFAEIRAPFLVIMQEDDKKDCHSFTDALRDCFAQIGYCVIMPEEEVPWHLVPKDSDIIGCIFSEVRAWKSKTDPWIQKTIESFGDKARIFISFGNPYTLRKLKKAGSSATRIYAFWDSGSAERAVALRLSGFAQRPS